MNRMLCTLLLLATTGLAYAQPEPETPEIFVAKAATLYGSTEFGGDAEEQAIQYLAEALVSDPSNAEAQALVEAIQKRRQERQEQQQQQGQQQIDQQQQRQQEQQSDSSDQQDHQDQREEKQQQGEDQQDQNEQEQQDGQSQEDDRLEQPEPQDSSATAQEQAPKPEDMTREEAERLLNALDEQEQAPQATPRRGTGSKGPRW